MRKLAFLVCAFVCLTLPVWAQKTAANPFGAGLSVQDAGTCSTAGSFIWQTSLPQTASTTTVNLAGTFSGTLTIRLSNNGGQSWTTLGTATSAGTTTVNTNGYTDICADVTTYTSGIFQVNIFTGSTGAGGGGSVSLPTTQVSAASYAGADWCAKVQAADAAIGANPGIIIVPASIGGSCAGTLTFAYNGLAASRVIVFDLFSSFTGAIAPLPNDGGATPQQAAFRFTGSAQSNQNGITGSDITSGSTLNLTNNAANGKIESLGLGHLEIDHLNIVDTSTDCATFVFDTNTQVSLHNTHFFGTAAGSSACNDAIILGGTGTTNGGLVTSIFGGYGTVIRDNTFGNMKRIVIFQSGANGVQVVDNQVQGSCGDTTGAPFEFNSASGTNASGNYVAGNLVEVLNYEFFVNVTTSAGNVQMNDFIGNGMFDASATTSAYFNFNAITNGNSIKNYVILGNHSTVPVNGIAVNLRDNFIRGPNAYQNGPDSGISFTCSMSTGTTCTISNVFGQRCVATVQGATPIAAACSLSGTTVTVTAASSNSAAWAVWVF